MIQVGVVGVVLNGRHPEMKVQVIDDTAGTGGYFIFKWWPGSAGIGPDRMFDDWVESWDDLQVYWRQSGWQVQWAGPDS